MALGPGKYDAEATAAREATGAEAVVLVVAGGDRGAGFSVQQVARAGADPWEGVVPLIVALRAVTEQMTRDYAANSRLGKKARTRLALETARTSLAMIAHELGGASPELLQRGPRVVDRVAAAVNNIEAASSDIAAILEELRRPEAKA